MSVDPHQSEVAVRGTRRRSFLLGLVALVTVGTVLGFSVDSTGAATNPSVAIEGIGQFEVLSYSWGSSAQSGSPNTRTHDLSFVKVVDAFSPALSAAVASGQLFTTASITVAGKNGKSVRYEMTDVFISSYSVGSGTPTGDATENVTLHFASVKTVHK